MQITRIEKTLVDSKALKEAIINAMVHNDYSSGIPPVFEIFSDRFTITSYGGLPQEITKEDLAREFNPTVAMLVDGVSKLPKFSINNSKLDTDNFNLKKLFLSLVSDIRVILIKICDRLHNMRTLQYHTPEKQVENSRETEKIYVPFASLIGAYNIKQ